MPLKRQRFTVYLNSPVDEGSYVDHDPLNVSHIELDTEVIFADQLRGELEARKHGISLDLQLHSTTVMIWCALVREGKYEKDFQTFKTGDLLDFQKHEATDVDPTQPGAPTGSPSSSPTTSPPSPTPGGTTPTTD